MLLNISSTFTITRVSGIISTMIMVASYYLDLFLSELSYLILPLVLLTKRLLHYPPHLVGNEFQLIDIKTLIFTRHSHW